MLKNWTWTLLKVLLSLFMQSLCSMSYSLLRLFFILNVSQCVGPFLAAFSTSFTHISPGLLAFVATGKAAGSFTCAPYSMSCLFYHTFCIQKWKIWPTQHIFADLSWRNWEILVVNLLQAIIALWLRTTLLIMILSWKTKSLFSKTQESGKSWYSSPNSRQARQRSSHKSRLRSPNHVTSTKHWALTPEQVVMDSIPNLLSKFKFVF